jgi:hypothetical protein
MITHCIMQCCIISGIKELPVLKKIESLNQSVLYQCSDCHVHNCCSIVLPSWQDYAFMPAMLMFLAQGGFRLSPRQRHACLQSLQQSQSYAGAFCTPEVCAACCFILVHSLHELCNPAGYDGCPTDLPMSGCQFVWQCTALSAFLFCCKCVLFPA